MDSDAHNTFGSWRRLHQGLSAVAAGAAILLTLIVVTSVVRIGIAGGVQVQADIVDNPNAAHSITSLLGCAGLVALAPIAVGLALCCLAPERTIRRRACISLALSVVTAGTAYLLVVVHVFLERIPRQDLGIGFFDLTQRLGPTLLVPGLALAAFIAWLLMHIAIAKVANAPGREARIRLFGFVCVVAVLVYSVAQASEMLDGVDGRLAMLDPAATMLIAILILGGQLVLLRTSMATIGPMMQEEAANPAVDEPRPVRLPEGWQLTRDSLVRMSWCVGILLSGVLVGHGIALGLDGQPVGPARQFEGICVGGLCFMAIVGGVLFISGMLCCQTPDRTATWWARGCFLGIALTVLAIPIVGGILESRRPFARNFFGDDPPPHLPGGAELIAISILITGVMVTLSCVVLFHAAVGRRFGQPHIGIVGAIYFGLSMGAMALFAPTFYLGSQVFLNRGQTLAMITANVIAAIVWLGGYIILVRATIQSMRGSPLEPPTKPPG